MSTLREALERIAKSNVHDMNTLHPDACAAVARAALAQDAGVGEESQWPRIRKKHRPLLADEERKYLATRLAKHGPMEIVRVLDAYAVTAPPQGSYGGSLMAIAEYLAAVFSAAPSPPEREPSGARPYPSPGFNRNLSNDAYAEREVKP